MRILALIGLVMVGIGLLGLVGFVGFYEISVPNESGYGPERVVNLGRMHERNLGVGLSLAAVVIGGALAAMANLSVTRANRPRCPFCSERIEELAVVCPHCRRDQPRGALRGVNAVSKPLPDQVDEWFEKGGGGA